VGFVSNLTDQDRFFFVYSDAWRANPARYPLSPHMPLEGEIRPNAVRRFLQNLLPEGRALDVASTFSSISKNNIFALIRRLGQETVGALSFQASDTPPERQPAREREVTHEELAERIKDRMSVPFTIWDGKVRMSIAGYQDKLLVLARDDRLFLVEGALASTHILKPESMNPTMPHLVANEHFCMTLAARLAMPVAPVRILRLPEPVLLVERFDRIVDAHAVHRRHVIDACQALDLPVDAKYERMWGDGRDVAHMRDGASFEKLFTLRQYLENKAQGQLLLLRWALLQIILGNSDAHGKNISFFIDRVGLAVAPFYDLVSAVQYDESQVNHQFAMGFGDAFSMAELGGFQFADFAQLTRMDRRLIRREARRLSRAVETAAPLLAKEGRYIDAEREMVEKIAGYAVKQAAQLVEIADSAIRVGDDML